MVANLDTAININTNANLWFVPDSDIARFHLRVVSIHCRKLLKAGAGCGNSYRVAERFVSADGRWLGFGSVRAAGEEKFPMAAGRRIG